MKERINQMFKDKLFLVMLVLGLLTIVAAAGVVTMNRGNGQEQNPYVEMQGQENLLAGDFPEELKELFTQRGGLFPSSREISFSCSCPDWALMCKHVAAVLYGIGARLDENPSLFFELRGIEMGRFIDVAIANRVERMLKNAGQTSSWTMEEGDIRGLFGI